MGSVFFHIDLDAFFASVEILDNPEYRGKPLIIGTPGPRHVASTCSYEARKYGVHSAMPMTEALRLCPNAICIPGRMHRYSEMSRRVMGIISSFAPGFLQVSVDEAFLDLTGMERIYPLPGKAARKLKDEIRKETGLTASIGVASSRFVAKLASDYRKPDGLTIVPRGKEEEFVSAVGLRKLWGIGDSTYQSLIRKGITSVEILRKYDENDLRHLFGESNGHYLYLVARGIDPGIYQGEAKSRSISAERTFYPDVFGYDATISIQTTPVKPIYSSTDVYNISRELLRSKYNGSGVRLIGVALQSIYDGSDVEQQDFFSEKEEKERKLEKTIIELKKKGSKLVKARNLKEE